MKPKLFTAAICIVALFSVNLAYGYHPISPYAYCAGNPIKYVDPDGKEVWIYYQDEDGNDQKMLYTANMRYDGSNSFISTAVNYLNNIYSYGGADALDVLIGSANAFDVTSEMSSVEGTLSFKENQNGGGTLKMGAIMTSGFEKSQGIESLAHELFHGVQHEQGQGGTSIFNEVEAYVFGTIVANNWMNAPYSDFMGGPHSLAGNGQTNVAGATYEKAFRALTNQFSSNAFGVAVKNFKTGAYKNATGLYNNYPVIRPNQTKYLLPRFYPR